MRAIALILLLAFGCAAPIQAQTTEVEVIGDPAIYGPYPKDYQVIVTKWLEMKLVDPASAVIDWTSAPKPAELPGLKGQKLHGYLVEFTVKARNRFGAYTGKQKHGALIREGVVIKGTGFGF